MHIATWEREDILERMRAVVDGELDLLANVSHVTDWDTVINVRVPLYLSCSVLCLTYLQHYKLDQKERKIVDNIVVSSVAIKSV
jgi:hypothetical protein